MKNNHSFSRNLLMRSTIWLALLAVGIGLTGCPKDHIPPYTPTGMLELNMTLTAGGAEFRPFSEYTEPHSGRKLVVDSCKLFIARAIAINDKGEEFPLAELTLLDYANAVFTGKTAHNSGVFLSQALPQGTYRGIKLYLGVPPDSTLPDVSTLVTSNQLHPSKGMYRSPGSYWYARLKGRVAGGSDAQGTPDSLMDLGFYEPQWYRQLDFANLPQHQFMVYEGYETQFVLELDIFKLFSPTDAGNNITLPQERLATQPGIMARFYSNLTNGFIPFVVEPEIQ